MAKQLNDWHRYFLWEFVEDYKDGFMPRRELLKRAVYLTGGLASAASVLSLMGCGGSASPSAAPSSAIPAPSSAAPKPSAPASAAASASAKPAASTAASAKPAASASAKPAASGAASAKPAASGSAAAKPAAAAPTPTGPRSPLSVPANDPAVETRDVSFPGAGGVTLLGYEAKPKAAS